DRADHHPGPGRVDLVGDLLRAIAVDVEKGDVGARLGEADRRGPANPTRGTGHNRCGTREVHGPPPESAEHLWCGLAPYKGPEPPTSSPVQIGQESLLWYP